MVILFSVPTAGVPIPKDNLGNNAMQTSSPYSHIKSRASVGAVVAFFLISAVISQFSCSKDSSIPLTGETKDYSSDEILRMPCKTNLKVLSGSLMKTGLMKSITLENSGEFGCVNVKGVITLMDDKGTVLGETDFIIRDAVKPFTKQTFQDVNLTAPLPVKIDKAKKGSVLITEGKHYVIM
jgi:hypothetical protein